MIPKFRAWHIEEKRMFNVICLDYDIEGNEIACISEWNPEKAPDGHICNYSISQVILMQSTGLFDKNGKEIFEDDTIDGNFADKSTIVHNPTSNRGVVYYNKEECCYKVKGKYDKRLGEYFPLSIEVVNNVHDNPELKEVKDDTTRQE